jgi:hypothetical protein
MWSVCFPLIWDNHLIPSEKERFKEMALSLLGREYHLKQARVQPNVVQVSIFFWKHKSTVRWFYRLVSETSSW